LLLERTSHKMKLKLKSLLAS